jgi:hypothetical protein
VAEESEPNEPEAEPQSDEDEDEPEKPFTRDDFIRDLRKVAKPEK